MLILIKIEVFIVIGHSQYMKKKYLKKGRYKIPKIRIEYTCIIKLKNYCQLAL